MISADFCAIAVLISMGSVIGKASLSQLIVMATFEVVLQSLNEFIGVKYLQVKKFYRIMYSVFQILIKFLNRVMMLANQFMFTFSVLTLA